MLGPIPPVTTGAAALPAVAADSLRRPNACANSGSTIAVRAAQFSSIAPSQSVAAFQMAEMLRTIGGDTPSEKVLQTLLALIVFMAMLAEDRKQDLKIAGLLSGLANGLAQSSGSASVTMSYEIQSTQTISAAPGSAPSQEFQGSTGQHVDFLA